MTLHIIKKDKFLPAFIKATRIGSSLYEPKRRPYYLPAASRTLQSKPGARGSDWVAIQILPN